MGCSAASSSGRMFFRRGPLVARRNDDLERLLVEELGDHARRREGQRDDRRIDASGFQRGFEMHGEVLLEVERHLRREDMQCRNEVGQQVGCHRVDDPQLQRADQLIAPRLRDPLDQRRLLQHLLRLLHDASADRRQRDLALAPLEEADVELLFQLLDRDRQRRLAHEAALRGAAEALLGRHRDDIAKLAQCHCGYRLPRSRRKAAKSSARSGCLRPKSTVASR